MTYDELCAFVWNRYRSMRDTTVCALAFVDACGLPRELPGKRNCGHIRDKSAKARKYRGVRKLMKQTHGVNL